MHEEELLFDGCESRRLSQDCLSLLGFFFFFFAKYSYRDLCSLLRYFHFLLYSTSILTLSGGADALDINLVKLTIILVGSLLGNNELAPT